MDWFRHYHGLCTDPKLHRVARTAGVSRGLVVAAWCAVLETASGSNPRGCACSLDDVALAFMIDTPPHRARKILAALHSFGLIDDSGNVTAWNKRQRESDDASVRKRKNRARDNAAKALNGHDSRTTCHVTNPQVEQNRTDKSKRSLTDTPESRIHTPESMTQDRVACSPQEAAQPPPRRKKVVKEYPVEFEELWLAYPRREEDDKAECLKHWRTVAAADNPASILTAAYAYREIHDGNDFRFGLRRWLGKRLYKNPVPKRRESQEEDIFAATERMTHAAIRGMKANGYAEEFAGAHHETTSGSAPSVWNGVKNDSGAIDSAERSIHRSVIRH